MRTNTKAFRAKVREYIMDVLAEEYGPPYGSGVAFGKDDLKRGLETVAADFSSWSAVEMRRSRKSYQQLFSDWLNCAPSSFDVHFYDYEINDIMASWGLTNDDGKYPQERTNFMFHYLLYSELLKLCKENNVNLF